MSSSAFAGNVLLIDLAELQRQGWLERRRARARRRGCWTQRVDFAAVRALSHAAPGAARRSASPALPAQDERRAQFAQFCAAPAAWLDDYALFMALSEAHDWRDWCDWAAAAGRGASPARWRRRAPQHAERIAFWKFCQWCFFRQWLALKAYANERGVQIVGDVPIFIAHHSAEVWAHQALFELDADGRPTVVAGVPPDFFSATGQRWGNPLYRWEAHAARRLRLVGGTHARASSSWWTSCASTTSAASPATGRSRPASPRPIKGRWRSGPGRRAVQGHRKPRWGRCRSLPRTWA